MLNNQPYFHVAIDRIHSLEKVMAETPAEASTDRIIEYMDNDLAVLRMEGFFVPWRSEYNMSVPNFSDAVNTVMESGVKDVIIRSNTGGGYAEGVDALAKQVYSLAQAKNVYGVVEGTTASAGYYVLSQATKGIFLSDRTNEVGSIGTYMAIADQSEALENAGVKVFEFKTGALKGAGFGGKITEEQVSYFQNQVETLQGFFEESVQRGRPDLDISQVNSGGVFFADEAIDLNLADGYKTTQELMTEIKRKNNINSRFSSLMSNDKN